MKAIKTVLGVSLFASIPAFAQEGGGLSDAETSFTGAVMLTGDIDVTFDSFDEGRDYYYLSASQDGREIEQLRQAERIYESTVNAILLTEGGYSAVLDYLDG